MADSSPTKTRVLVIAAARLYRDGIAQALGRREHFEVAGTARTAAEAIERLPATRPDVSLVDLALPGSLDLVRALRVVHPGGHVVALGVPEDEIEVIACAEAGVAGLVTLEGSLEDLEAMLESVGRGETLCSPRMAAALLRRVATLADGNGAESAATLTARERQVMQLLERGLSNKEIARELHIEPTTVKNHVHNILEKLHVRRRAEAAARFRRRVPVHRALDRSAVAGAPGPIRR